MVLNLGGINPIYYEFKSVKEIKDEYIQQFIKDLSRSDVANLSQIKWIFDHDKMSLADVKTKFLASMLNNKNLIDPLLINGKLQSFMPATIIINTTDDFINELFKANTFNEIFK